MLFDEYMKKKSIIIVAVIAVAAICALIVWLDVCEKKLKAEERAQWNKEFEQQKADWMSGFSEPEGYGLVSDLAPDAIFHTYRLKNVRIRQFCDYVPTSPDAIEFHYLGVIEEGDDTVRFVNDGDGMFVQTLITVSPLYRRIAENGRLLFVATYDTKSYFLYRIECESLKVSRFAENINISAIKATESGFVVTESRVSNFETAKCNADYEYLFHDITLDLDGRILKNDSTHEYDLEELERRYDSDDPFPIVWR